MRIKDGFFLREVGGKTVVISACTDLELNKMITLNETGTFLWKLLEKETTSEELLQELLKAYDVDEETAKESISRFVGKLEKNGFFAE